MNEQSNELSDLAGRLATRREAILQAWRTAGEKDPQLTTMSALSRSQFNDHMPQVLELFEERLASAGKVEPLEPGVDQKTRAAEHGLHRWHHGYSLREVTAEWGHLQLVLLEELEAYASDHPDLSPGVMPAARRTLARLCSNGVNESAAQYAKYQQLDALGRLRDLEQALIQVKALEQQRAEFWREAAHDLRGNLGVVRNATALLAGTDINEQVRVEFLAILERNVESLNVLLTDLMTLARLEAGQEQRRIAQFDAGASLSELCSNFQPLAAQRGLFLRCSGPASLMVEGDFMRTRRIVQNLVLNALKYTERGGVKVTWEVVTNGQNERWALCVEDTGPGFSDGPVAPLARFLKKSTDESREVEEEAEEAGDPTANPEPAPTLPSQSTRKPLAAGEGVGLSIVKRLCELLDATLDLETRRGQGSTFRVTFPRRYPDVTEKSDGSPSA